MKVLKKVSEGLVLHEDFDGAMHPLLINKANMSVSNSIATLNNGGIFFNSVEYPLLVFEVKNSYLPQSDIDFGGLSVSNEFEKKDLFEYKSDEGLTVPYVKIVKQNEVYHGYGSEDDLSWYDRGYIVFPCSNYISVNVVGESPYELDSIKIYKEETITLFALLAGWKIKVKVDDEVIMEETTSQSTHKLKLPYYPFDGDIEILDEDDEIIATDSLTGVWGGDEYYCTVDVDLLTLDNVSLNNIAVQHLGNLLGNKIQKKYKARNNSDESVTVTIEVAEYTDFSEWAFLSTDDNGSPFVFGKSITVTIPPLDEVFFWLKVERPDNFNMEDYNYKEVECMFFLEVK
jgi:hypothetical protein